MYRVFFFGGGFPPVGGGGVGAVTPREIMACHLQHREHADGTNQLPLAGFDAYCSKDVAVSCLLGGRETESPSPIP